MVVIQLSGFVITPDAGSEVARTLVHKEDLALIDANGTSGTLQADLSKWLHPGASLIKTRLVSISADTNDTTYSNPHYFEVRNNSVRMLILLLQMEEQRFSF